jgi:FkbM family methyltransferase
MLRFGDVTRKFNTAYRAFNEEGFRGMTSVLRTRIDFSRRLRVAQRIKSINLDGCVIDMGQIPDSQTKIDLAEEVYERAERRLVPRHLDPHLPVVELGGCIGVIACLTNRMLHNPERHVVVEANPLAIPLLMAIRDKNQCRFEILHKALAYDASTASFQPELNLCANSIQHNPAGKPSVTIPATTLRNIVSERDFESFNLICDIEGYEWELVCKEPDVLRKAEVLMIETHARFIGEAKTAQLLSSLVDLGFRIVDQEETVVALKRHHSLETPTQRLRDVN